MAIKKKIKLHNGIDTEYHRILMIKLDINQTITVLVKSYLNADERNKELDFALGKVSELNAPFSSSEYISFTYDENMDMFKGNITQNVYKWLKKQEKFKDAEDI